MSIKTLYFLYDPGDKKDDEDELPYLEGNDDHTETSPTAPPVQSDDD